MRRITIVLLVLTVLTGTYPAENSPAQQTSSRAGLKSTKVGVVNLTLLFAQYEKAKLIKDRVEKEASPYKVEKDELEKTIEEWKEIVANGKVKEKNIARGQQIIIDCQRQLEDLDHKLKKEDTQRVETEMAQVYKEIAAKIREHAEKHGYHLILAYGEPVTPLAPLVQFQRHMKIVDQGGVTKVFAGGGIDVSMDIVKTLNSGKSSGRK